MPGFVALDAQRPWALIQHCQLAGRPLPDCGRLWPIQANPVEESPGSMETRWRLTAAGGDPRESATESKPPAGFAGQVRVKGCGKSAPRGRRRSRQGKPHREQDQIGVAGRARKRGARSVFRPATRVGCLRRLAMGVPDEWPSRRGKPSRQNPAYRPAGNFLIGVSDYAQFAERSAAALVAFRIECQSRLNSWRLIT